MRVMYICGDTERIGGIEKYNRDFIAALKMADVKLKVVQRYPGGLFAKISFMIRVLLHFFLFRPQINICGHLHFAPVCYFLSLIFKTPYTLSLYGIEIISLAGNLKHKVVEKACQVVTISAYSRQLILDKFPHIEPKIFMHPSAVDGSLYFIKAKNNELLHKYNIEGKQIILSLARLSTHEFKGQDRVLKALPEVLKIHPDAVYLIVGGGEDLRVSEFTQKNPQLAKNVVFTGPCTDKEKVEFYNLADVYILPSKFEGFGIVFIEATACGIPVIASDGYGCRQGLLNGELGQLVPPDDLVIIAETLVKTLNSAPVKDAEYRQKLREKTMAVYGIEAWNKRVENLVTIVSKMHR